MKTNTKGGFVHITLYNVDYSDMEREKEVDIVWSLTHNTFWVDQCNMCGGGSDDGISLSNVPSEQNKEWKLTKNPKSLELQCNGVKVLDNYTFTDHWYCPGCFAQMNLDFGKIQFNELNDRATQHQTTGLK